MRAHRTTQRGFLGIQTDLMILVAVIGIVAAIAIPVALDYFNRDVVKPLVLDAMAKAAPWRQRIAEYAVRHKRFPRDGRELGVPGFESPPAAGIMAGEDFARLEVYREGAANITLAFRDRGVVELRFHGLPRTSYATLVYTPKLGGDAVTWECANRGLRASFAPRDCVRD